MHGAGKSLYRPDCFGSYCQGIEVAGKKDSILYKTFYIEGKKIDEKRRAWIRKKSP